MHIAHATSKLLYSAIPYLRRLDTTLYQRPLDVLSGASIGQHTRHYLEVLRCLLDSTARSESEIQYSARARDPVLESCPETAIRTITDLIAVLKEVDESMPCRVSSTDIHVQQAGDESVPSNVGRELLYNMDHIIHHFALIRIGLREIAPDFEPDPDFGIAPSTARYKKQTHVHGELPAS